VQSKLMRAEKKLYDESTHDLPESSYGAAMAMLVQAHDAEDWNVNAIAVVVYLVSLLSIAAEFFILITVKSYLTAPAVVEARSVYAEYHREMFNGETFLASAWDTWERKSEICQMPLSNITFCHVILAVWTACVMIDIKDTFFFAYLWGSLPASKQDDDGMVANFNEEDQQYVICKAPWSLKAIVFLTIIIPKLVIACICWWLGCRWLVATLSYSDVILNSVALAFIMELDEMVFYCMIPYDTQDWIRLHCITRPTRLTGSHKYLQDEQAAQLLTGGTAADGTNAMTLRKQRVRNSSITMMLTIGLVLLLPAIYIRYQQAIPGYKFDVAARCESYWDEITLALHEL